jgi:4'-phosphopantetheinyl transferase
LVWQVDATALTASCWDLLDAHEQTRAERYVRQADRIVFVATRAALRRALASITSVDPKSFLFEAGREGKPFIAAPIGLATLQFSVAHSESIGLIAIDPLRRVGIDLERRRHVDGWREIAMDILGQDTTSMLTGLDEGARHHAFLRCWTAAEAFAKATGLGLAGFGGRIPLCVKRSQAACLRITANETTSGAEWAIMELDLGKDHVGALVVESALPKLEINEPPMLQLMTPAAHYA